MTAKVRWNAGSALAVVLGLALVTAGCGNQNSTPGPLSAAVGAVGAGLQAEFEAIVDRVGPSVVLIQTSNGLGSGVVYDTEGNIVTNAHVVGDETEFMVSASDGRQMAAILVGSFPVDDLAVIRAEHADLPPATFGGLLVDWQYRAIRASSRRVVEVAVATAARCLRCEGELVHLRTPDRSA